MAMNPVLPHGVVDEEDFEWEYFLAEDEEILLSQWELINLSDTDSDADPDFDAAAISASVHGLPLEDVIPSAYVDPLGPFESIPMEDADFSALIEQYRNDLLEISRVVVADNRESNRRDEYEDEEDEDDDGLDDELVPRHLSGTFGKQRMRKVGKRIVSTMNKSKRSPFYMKSRRIL